MQQSRCLTTRLESFGWDEELAAAFAALERPELEAARVGQAMRKHCVVWTEDAEVRVRVPKRVFRAEPGAPVVGDWVAIGDDERMAAVLPRRSSLSRRAAGRTLTEQVVVANVDTAFVMVGLDGDFNLRRIERYLAVAWQGGVTPVVLLNKADLHADPEQARRDVVAIASGAEVLLLAAKHGEGLEALEAHLRPRRTVVVLGSSGVGKSTLVNQVLGVERMRTREVRARDERGRHTTTHRELIPLPSGALLIDTPGMRELGLLDHGDGIAEAFADVEALAAACRFADCQHDGEPGCAIAEALASGELDEARLASYHKLTDEVETANARRAKEERFKKMAITMRKRRKGR